MDAAVVRKGGGLAKSAVDCRLWHPNTVWDGQKPPILGVLITLLLSRDTGLPVVAIRLLLRYSGPCYYWKRLGQFMARRLRSAPQETGAVVHIILARRLGKNIADAEPT
jgi:hypothetical protein